MADTPSVYVIENGFRNAVIQFALQSDGSGLTAYKIFDATSGGSYGVNVGGQVFYPGIHTKVVGLSFDVQDMKFKLSWEATANFPFLAFGASPEDFDWSRVGGLPCPAVAGATGSILLDTIDPMPDSTLSLTLFLRKGIKTT